MPHKNGDYSNVLHRTVSVCVESTAVSQSLTASHGANTAGEFNRYIAPTLGNP